MSNILDNIFGKQTGTSVSLKRKPNTKTITRGKGKHLKQGIGKQFDDKSGGSTGGTNQEIEYTMWIDPYWQTVFVDGVDVSTTMPMGMVYPLLLSAGSIEPQNLMTIDVSDPYPWAITVYADSSKVVFGDQTSSGTYTYLWPPDVQGGGGK
jgi:hypothetical protein